MGFNAKAIILRGIDYGENDRIIKLLIEDHGKASAMVKGARKEKSKLRGAVEPLTLGTYQLNAGRNMFVISQAEIIKTFSGIKNSLEGIMAAQFMSELVDFFLEEGNPDEATFQLFVSTLEAMEIDSKKWKQTVLYFEVQLHVINGIFPDFHQCSACKNTKTADKIRLDLEKGGALCSNCSSLVSREPWYPVDALFVLDEASNCELGEFLNRTFDERALDTAQQIIARFTSFYLGKEPKSRSMLARTKKKE